MTDPDSNTTASNWQPKPIYCPRRHGVECDTPNACAGGAVCRFGPDLNTHMNDRPSISNTTDEREYTREEMREACRNNYNAALLEARLAAIEMARDEGREAAVALRLFAHTLYELAQR